MFDIAQKNILANKVRSVLCIIGVMICVFLIGIIQGLSNQLEESVTGDVFRLKNRMYFQQKEVLFPPFGSNFDASGGEELLERTDIDPDMSTELLFVVIEPAENPRDSARVFGVGLSPGKERAYIADTEIAEGRESLAGEAENAVILGDAVAEFYDVGLGNKLTIRNSEFQVVGILDDVGVANIDNGILMSLRHGQQVFGRLNQVSAVVITPGEGQSIAEIERDIERAHTNFEVKTQREIEAELEANLETPRTILGMINAVVFAVTIVIITNVMMMSVKEKTREIGTMRAIGTQRNMVILIIFYETLILSLVGGLLGVATIIPASYIIGISWLPALLSLAVILRIAILVLLVGAFSGLLPAYLVTRVSPLEALRYE